ncbi:MAG TPA: DUF429 domain-containing protein [Thermoanaerobaculia bacterium]|nr:DUF429 domain-containing protein [Thermoanaerobaculia bacterium]
MIWYGIDFSGSAEQWRSSRSRTNVWISRLEDEGGDRLVLDLLVPVQEIAGAGHPFSALCELLGRRNFLAAGIDAPFSLPAGVLGERAHGALLRLNDSLDRGDRPFPKAGDLVAAVLPDLVPRGKKQFRETERVWQHQGLSVRSTVWAGPRGGAAMTAACLRLLAESGCPIWPWAPRNATGLLVEAYPAAQLRAWELCHQKYADQSEGARANREAIIRALRQRVDLGAYEERLASSADAVDAVVAAFAAVAVTQDTLQSEPPAIAEKEGWIAVHAREVGA